MPWTNRVGRAGEGLVMDAAVIAQDTPATGANMDVQNLDYVSFAFTHVRVAATSVEWWYEGTLDGTTWHRLPVNPDASSPPNITQNKGEKTRAWVTGEEQWIDPNVNVTGLKGIRPVVDSTAGTTDEMSIYAYGEGAKSR